MGVFDEVKRILKPGGTCFVNLGDKYVNKRRMLIPERFAIGMADNHGWILRNYIVWHKLNPKPESMRSRFTNDWESIFFFVKSEEHHFNLQYAEYAEASVKRCKRFVENNERFDPNRHKHDPANARQAAMQITERVAREMIKNLAVPGQSPHGMHKARINGDGSDVLRRPRAADALRVVVPGRQVPEAHFATWPPRPVKHMIFAGCHPRRPVEICFEGDSRGRSSARPPHRPRTTCEHRNRI